MAKKIKITADSTADFTPEMLKQLDITVSPLAIILGNKSYKDGVDITPQMIFDFVAETGVLPKTAATNPEEYTEFFTQFLDGETEIIHFSLSSKISAVNGNACAAAAGLQGVYVVDSLSLSTGTALLAMYAKNLVRQGKHSAKEIADMCVRRVPDVQASFIVDTLDYLHKGGRCSGIALLGSKILKIKPTIILKDGKMESDKKFLGKIGSNALKYVDYILSKFDKPDPTRVFVTHSNADREMVEEVKDYLKKSGKFKEVIETVAGSTITSHCGKNTIGILYINNNGDK